MFGAALAVAGQRRAAFDALAADLAEFAAAFDDALATELRGLAMPWAAAQALLAMGVPCGFLAQLTEGDIGVAQVDLRSAGLFDFGGPDRRLILAVRDECGALTDLAALSSTAPDEWALRTGCGELLGASVLEESEARAAVHGRAELRLFGTPLRGCAGAAKESACSTGTAPR